ncbi:MAG TPA: hypothetical protein VEK06_03540, partial [Myxococcota bacterium]|nr:hypothetical protein [Myxococcota bacterium]
ASSQVFCTDIGTVSDDGLIRIMHDGHELVHLGAIILLENAPRLRLNYQSLVSEKPGPYLKNVIKYPLAENLLKLDENLAEEKNLNPVQFDAHLGLNTVVAKNEADAVALRLPSLDETVALTMLLDQELINLNPTLAAKRAVFAAGLGLAAQGATMNGISCSLYAGSCEQKAVMTTIKHAIDAIAECASYLNIPVLSASTTINDQALNQVSLTLSAFGLCQTKRSVRFGNAQNGDKLVVLGQMPTDFLGVENVLPKKSDNFPPFDLLGNECLMTTVRHCVSSGVSSCVSLIHRGGFFQSLRAIMAKTGLGLKLEFGPEWLPHELTLSLISESTARVVMAVSPHRMDQLQKACAHKVAVYPLGSIGGDSLLIFHDGNLIYDAK